MDEGQKSSQMWTLGFGDSNETLRGENPKPPQKRVLASDWKIECMPHPHTEVELNVPLTDDEFEVLALGHCPEVMEDHWFMYFDGRSFNFHRSWTGFCIYQVHVERAHSQKEGYVITGATVNRCKDQYTEVSDERDRLMIEILVFQSLGKDVSRQWDAYFSLRVPEVHTEDLHPAAQFGFWREADPLGCCSNWHPTGFDFRGIHYATGEHWMMWQKARLMGDAEKATQILVAPRSWAPRSSPTTAPSGMPCASRWSTTACARSS